MHGATSIVRQEPTEEIPGLVTCDYAPLNKRSSSPEQHLSTSQSEHHRGFLPNEQIATAHPAIVPLNAPWSPLPYFAELMRAPYEAQLDHFESCLQEEADKQRRMSLNPQPFPRMEDTANTHMDLYIEGRPWGTASRGYIIPQKEWCPYEESTNPTIGAGSTRAARCCCEPYSAPARGGIEFQMEMHGHTARGPKERQTIVCDGFWVRESRAFADYLHEPWVSLPELGIRTNIVTLHFKVSDFRPNGVQHLCRLLLTSHNTLAVAWVR